MIRSMTAYASRTGTHEAVSWAWEMRGVNGRGMDFKPRLPDGYEALEAAMRTKIKTTLNRGVVTVTLRVSRGDTSKGLSLDPEQLERVLTALDDVQDRAFSMGVTLNQPSTADVLAQRGVIINDTGSDAPEEALIAVLITEFEALLADFVEMRTNEGAALQAILTAQIEQIDMLVGKAQSLLPDRAEASKSQMQASIKRIQEETSVDPDRLAQELALLAVKQDITEELDRLATHVGAARQMLGSDQPVGRKLDFLSQEFNREANTLCAKSQFAPLTTVGLDLKAVIDQMREQIQNVE